MTFDYVNDLRFVLEEYLFQLICSLNNNKTQISKNFGIAAKYLQWVLQVTLAEAKIVVDAKTKQCNDLIEVIRYNLH